MPVAFITHPTCSLHEMGPYHPECPERLSAVGDRMIAAGVDSYLRHYTATEATREQIIAAENGENLVGVNFDPARDEMIHLIHEGYDAYSFAAARQNHESPG